MKKIKLLAIDDEEDFLHLLGNRLKQRGYEVDTCDCCCLMEKEPFDYDIVITDHHMPNTTSKDIYTLVKQKKDIPVITMTGIKKEAYGLLEVTGDVILEKPVLFEDLDKIIKEQIKWNQAS